jgi:hypothetical protein
MKQLKEGFPSSAVERRINAEVFGSNPWLSPPLTVSKLNYQQQKEIKND